MGGCLEHQTIWRCPSKLELHWTLSLNVRYWPKSASRLTLVSFAGEAGYPQACLGCFRGARNLGWLPCGGWRASHNAPLSVIANVLTAGDAILADICRI